MPVQITKARGKRRLPMPRWTEQTPHAHEYYLLADDPNVPSSWVQLVPLKRSEFVALKHHLATTRGYAQLEAAHA